MASGLIDRGMQSIGILIVIGVVVVIVALSSADRATGSETAVVDQRWDRKWTPGDHASMGRTEPGIGFTVFDNALALSDHLRARAAHDTIGEEEAEAHGRVVQSGTEVLVIDVLEDGVRVRVLAGPHLGYAGWCMRWDIVALPAAESR